MQLMPELPMASFTSQDDPDFNELTGQVQEQIRSLSEAHGVSLAEPFKVTVVNGQASIFQLDPAELEGPRGSAREINALMSEGRLPDEYTSGESLADDPLWAEHLDSSWGF